MVRKFDKLSMLQWILLFIVFLAAVWIFNVTLEHFGITPPFEKREPYRPLTSGFKFTNADY